MTHTATLENGTQVLIEHWPDGSVTVASKSSPYGSWGPPVQAVKA